MVRREIHKKKNSEREPERSNVRKKGVDLMFFKGIVDFSHLHEAYVCKVYKFGI